MNELNLTPKGDRIHIALFGKTNVGKSSVINALTSQDIALVSNVKGTTTDPVYKAMELLPLGPVMIIDTAGLDDTSNLGNLRREKTFEVLDKTDIAILVLDVESGVTDYDKTIYSLLSEKKIPLIGVLNKIDKKDFKIEDYASQFKIPIVPVSALKNTGIDNLKDELIRLAPENEDKFKIVGDLLSPGDIAILVTPIDKAAPKGRLILPQQQTIRDILESDAIAIVTKEFELRETLESLNKKPKIVITDSQVFLKVAADTPKDILMTSFSILMARHKGDLIELARGAKAIENLKDGDKVLIAEACTHHRQSDDIGKVKIPRWLRQKTGKKLEFDFSSGFSFPSNIEDYALIVHCAGCMLNRRSMLHRIDVSVKREVPIVNYGVLIAYVQGILPRALKPFPYADMIFNSNK
ncbi:[FeFe] hydrogenase H-cluster maturation GTPase HydF [Clostridium felsineum]|uniref:[FeFe] hydrogenase H-cluster maturation GTPase HydF n=1 Tax=Clostridium felsineum TaxID=36839 RepID=UPI00098C442F|nr:[FeFe] hydrogenase H-cluster maturation GTPase HydF [Clostridium felsineum]URZ00506.1 GTPase Der [Clostridium felsineum]URZ16413.1 GTPase Der [Clostridium felsineum DSM 794]